MRPIGKVAVSFGWAQASEVWQQSHGVALAIGLWMLGRLVCAAADPETRLRVVRFMVMLDPEQCRVAAEKCRREAERALSPIERERWLKMAVEWSDLARQAEERKMR